MRAGCRAVDHVFKSAAVFHGDCERDFLEGVRRRCLVARDS